LSFRVTRDASIHSGGSSVSSLPVSEGCPSDRQPVGLSALPYPVSHPDHSSNNCNQKMTQGHPQKKPSPNKQFPCSVCNKLFTEKSSVKIHMRIHSGEKPYTCKTCGKSYTQKANLKSHLKIHTGERPHTCKECGKSFTELGNPYLFT
ncbi:hypothetical protein NPIL_649221, partial [Nephila pilipes]